MGTTHTPWAGTTHTPWAGTTAGTMEDSSNIPGAYVQRIIKDALPDGIALKKDAKTAATKSATVFVQYITHMANQRAEQNKHKIIQAQDVIEALDDMEMSGFKAELEKQ